MPHLHCNLKVKKFCPLQPLFIIFLKKLKPGLLFLLVLFLLGAFSTGAAASPLEGFVVQGADRSYYQYCYRELLDSYALKIRGQSNGLYENFTAKKVVAIYTGSRGYIDYAAVLDYYALAVIKGQTFSLSQYLDSAQAVSFQLPYPLTTASISTGVLISVENSLKEEPGPDVSAVDSAIVGPAQVELSTARQWAQGKNAHQRFLAIAPLYWEYGEKSGIRPEVLYAQAARETGFGHYRGLVPAEYNNWAGIKTADASGNEPEDHEHFETPEEGVRAHFNHMSAYVGLDPIGEPHGRYELVLLISWAGTVEKVEDLSGRWSPSPLYHEGIMAMIGEMAQQ